MAGVIAFVECEGLKKPIQIKGMEHPLPPKKERNPYYTWIYQMRCLTFKIGETNRQIVFSISH